MKKILVLCFIILLLIVPSCGFNNNETTITSTDIETTSHVHTFGEWAITKEPTCTSSGIKERSCICGAIETLDLPKLGHNYVDGRCTICNKSQYSEGLSIEISNDNKYAIVTGIGACTEIDIIIPPVYNGVPVKEIDDSAFSYCNDIKSVIIPESVKYIGNSAFYSCRNLQNVTMPKGLQSIEEETFCDCHSLRSIIIPDGVESIGYKAFYRCSSLISINIPNSVKTIEDSAFYACTGLTNIEVGKNVKSIGSNAFYDCTILYKIINHSGLYMQFGLPNNGKIAENAIIIVNDSSKLVLVDEQYQYYETDDGFLYRVTKQGVNELIAYVGNEETVSLPYELSCEDYSISFLFGVRNVIIPTRFTSINSCAFSHSRNLTSVVIPETIKHIGLKAFEECSNLKTIYYEGTQEEFKAINIESGNSEIDGAEIVYCYNQ